MVYSLIKPRNELTYASTLLPPGVGGSSRVSIFAFCSDVWGSVSSVNNYVSVSKISLIELNAVVKLKLPLSLKIADYTLSNQIINAVITTIVKNVECNSVPVPCRVLGRYNCSTIANVCGSCIGRKIGETGPSNNVCIDQNSAQSNAKYRMLAASNPNVGTHGYSCHANNDCFSGVCSRGVCTIAFKECLK